LSILYHYIVCERILFCKDDVIGWSDVHCAAGASTKNNEKVWEEGTGKRFA
jgi:hypothetical protein